MKILLDMDGVVADFMALLLEQYNHLTNEGVKLEDIRSNRTSKWVAEPFLIRKIIDTPGFIRYLKPCDGAIDGVTYLHGLGHDIVFVSNATNCPTSAFEKREWLKYYFWRLWPKKAPLILTHQKWHVRGDVIVDDDPKNFENLHPSTHALLWHTPYNGSVVGFDRIYDWSHLADWIEKNESV